MDYFRAAAISASAMTAEKMRLEAATANLAHMNVAQAPGTTGYQPVTVQVRARQAFSSALHGEVAPLPLVEASMVPQGGALVRQVHQPGHPDADAQGMVSYPAVDHLREMMTVMAAMRSYEANLAALQSTRTLAVRALDIGSGS
jgi:flagellar basal-body rod protein FlgC